MPRKAKSSGTVEFVNKPTEPSTPAPSAPEPSILQEPPKVVVPEQGTPTEAPPAPKAKRAYKKKNEAYWTSMKGKPVAKPEPTPEPPAPKNEVVYPEPATEPVAVAKRPRGRPRKYPLPPSTPAPSLPPAPSTPAPKPVKQKAPPKPPKVKAPPKPKRVRVYEPPSESEEDEDEDEDEDDVDSLSEESEEEDEPVVKHIAKKAVRRLKTLDKIDRRIKELSNSYSARGYSVF